MVTVADTFSGCGGMSKGFENAGFDIVVAMDNWDCAIKCYNQNFSSHSSLKVDLNNVEQAVEILRYYSPDIIIGGPPCQDYSSAGKRTEGDRANLTVCYANIVAKVKPAIFVMENVKLVKNSKNYASAISILKDAGYGISKRTLNACYCGVPQDRERFITVGVLGADDDVVIPYMERNLAKKPMTVRDKYGDTFGVEYYYRHPRSYARRGIFSIDEPSPTIRGVNRPIPKGYPGNHLDACPLNDSVRPLTTMERALIQTFPADWIWTGNKTDNEQMIGNAVPVKLAEYIANFILDFMRDNQDPLVPEKILSFEKWMNESKGYSFRSSKDVISRIKRANEIYGVWNRDWIESVLNLEEFDRLYSDVKSQLRKSVELYSEFTHHLDRDSPSGTAIAHIDSS